jgi:5-methylcytosine-specific restriction enzyme A
MVSLYRHIGRTLHPLLIRHPGLLVKSIRCTVVSLVTVPVLSRCTNIENCAQHSDSLGRINKHLTEHRLDKVLVPTPEDTSVGTGHRRFKKAVTGCLLVTGWPSLGFRNRCAVHRQAVEVARGTPAQRGYDVAHQAMRARVLAEGATKILAKISLVPYEQSMARLYDLRRWRDQCAPLVLVDEPWCRLCRAVELLTPAAVVDHIVPVRQNPDLAFERSNLQPLCKAHHDSAKKQQERRGYHGELDARGYPIDPAHPANRDRGAVASCNPPLDNRGSGQTRANPFPELPARGAALLHGAAISPDAT